MIGTGILGYTGSFLDPVTETYPLGNGYRMYLPWLMRFNAPDSDSPFGRGGISSYVYCLGDPINSTDPTGHGDSNIGEEVIEDLRSLYTPDVFPSTPPTASLSLDLVDLVDGMHAQAYSDDEPTWLILKKIPESDSDFDSIFNEAVSRNQLKINHFKQLYIQRPGGPNNTVLWEWDPMIMLEKDDGTFEKLLKHDKRIKDMMHRLGAAQFGRNNHDSPYSLLMPEFEVNLMRPQLMSRLEILTKALHRLPGPGYSPVIFEDTERVHDHPRDVFRKYMGSFTRIKPKPPGRTKAKNPRLISGS